jgi:anthranilate/para-aminobenzoate synthase component II
LQVDPVTLPSAFSIDAYAKDDGAIMAISHRELPYFGVQFHPESFESPQGNAILSAFLECA